MRYINLRFTYLLIYEASNDSGAIENVDFQGFRTLRLRHLKKWGQRYYIVLFSPFFVAFPLTPKYVTLNDFEWVEGHFTLYVHYYERPLTNYLLLIYCRLWCDVTSHVNDVMWPAEKCGKRSIAKSDPQSGRIFGIRGSSVEAISSEP